VELIEAHGTGTIVGDRTELATLTETFSATEAPLARCTLGSVKSQIGHTKCAAGLAGLIKVALSVHHGIRPATLHIESPNPYYQPETSPFHFHKTPAPWATPERVAGVSAFGFGGTNYHAVVTSYDGLDTPFTSHDDWPAELFIFRASDETSLSKQISQVRDAIRAMLASDSLTIAWKLRDVAHHVSTLGDGPIRLALVADSFEQLLERLSSASIGEAGPGVYLGDGTTAEGQVAFLCPGQGSQRPGMLKDIFVAFPWLSQHLQGGQRWWQTLFPGHAFTAEAKAAQRRAITDTRVAQPTLGMVELAAADLLATFGIRPDCIAGHSYGELVALTVAGALNASDLPAISEGRGISILESAGADPGTMAAVSAGADEVAAALPRSSDVVLANLNSPTQTVISGATPAVEAAVQTLKAAGLSARPIRVACAFHSPVVSGAAERFSKILEPASVRSPQYQVWSNSTAKPYPASPDAIRTQLAEHVVSPVRFVEQIEAMWAAGARTFIECGPGRVLSGLTQKILGDRPHRTVAIDQSGQHGLLSLLNALGELAVAGLPVDTQVLFRGREVRDIQPGAPDRHGASIWWVDGQRAKPAQGELPASAMSPVTKPVTQVTMGGSPLLSSESEREQLVLEYLQSMRQMVETQREVMLSYLGTPALGEVPVAHRAGDSAGVGTDKRTSVLAEKASKVAELQESPREILLHLVSERTGYPLEMLDLDLDLEADLSIDSIKRLEILGALGERIGLTDDEDTAARDAMVEELAQLKTLRALIDWLDTQVPAIESSQEEEALPDVQELLLGLVSERTGYPLEMLGLDLDLEADLSIDSIKRLEILGALGEQVGFGEGTPDERDQLVETLATKKTLRSIVEWLQSQIGAHASSSASEALPSEPDIEEPPPLQRFVVQVTPAPELGPTKMDLSGANVVIAPDDRGVAAALVEKLTVAGANPRLWNEDIVGGDVLIDLEGLRANGDQHPVKRSFDHAKVWAKTGAPKVLFASGLGGDFGRSYRGDQLPRGGSSGLLKSWMKESPALDAKLVDLDVESDAPDVLAGYVLSELIHKSGPSEVGWRAGERIQLSLGAQATSQDDENSVTLNAESVVLLTGGARGITARVAIALAEATGCSLELVGRSELPAPTDPPDIAEATDGAQLRRAFLARGETNLREVERLVRGVLSAREIRNTMQTLGDLGVDVNYHSVDVRDHEAVCSLVETIYEKRGRIDGVIHGAGVLDDRLMADKSAASFERVFDTKVIGAQALVERLRSDTQFVVFFSSVSGAFGNRGQVDYAAANDALDKLAFCLQQRIDGRVLSVNWGPWADTGMVNAALEREYRRRGIGLIPPDAGIRALLEELSSIQGPTQVVLMCADPSAMA
jgi:acyl transferase domain-containing protein